MKSNIGFPMRFPCCKNNGKNKNQGQKMLRKNVIMYELKAVSYKNKLKTKI